MARKVVLAEGEVYHIFNRGIEGRETFPSERDYQRFLKTVNYYQSENPPVRFSFSKEETRNKARERKKLVEIITFCLVSNHFHFILRQLLENGTSIFMSKIANSYTKYFNTKNKRRGPLFEGVFKAVRIETEEQLTHVSRYIHLHPLTCYLVNDLKKWEFSSYSEYLGLRKEKFSAPGSVLSLFKSPREYEQFVLDQVDYARKLAKIKKLLLEEV
jgi:putative transposase